MTSLVVLLVAAVALVRGSPLKGSPGLQPYHETVGIPMLARIKQYEMGRDFDGSRIVGGSAVPPGTHPFLGGIFINLADRRTSMCGATLLTNTRALTAAHCWFDGQLQAVQFTMVYGSAFLLSGGVRIPTAQVTMHENWNPLQAVQHDIAIVTHVWVTFNNNVNRILLPAGSQLNQNWVGLNAVAAGYGRTTDADLSAPARPEKNQVTLQVITNDVCMQYYGAANIDPSILCTSGAGGRNICSGDSGGPLSLGTGTSRVLIGVSSFGYQYCTAGIPAAFSRVTYYADWIRARI